MMTFAIVNNIFPMRPPFTSVQFLPASDKPQNDFHHGLRNASARDSALLLFVMRPESQDLEDPLLLESLIDHAMLDIYPAGIRAGKIADKLLDGGWDSKGFFSRFSRILCACSLRPERASFGGYKALTPQPRRTLTRILVATCIERLT
jgi:hypothetical protein